MKNFITYTHTHTRTYTHTHMHICAHAYIFLSEKHCICFFLKKSCLKEIYYINLLKYVGTRIKLKTLPGGIRNIVIGIKQDTERSEERKPSSKVGSKPRWRWCDLSVGGWRVASRAWFRVDRGESHCTAPVGATSQLRAFATSGTPVADSAESCTSEELAGQKSGQRSAKR